MGVPPRMGAHEEGIVAVKTITIDMEAYDILAHQKRQGESFSQVIKRRLRPARTAARLLTHLSEITLAEDTLDHTDKLISERQK